MVYWVAQGIALISFVVNVIGMQFNEKKKILLSIIFGGITSIISLCLLGAFSGVWMQIIFTLEAVVNYFILRVNDKISVWVGISYLLVTVVSQIFVFKSAMDVFPFVATVLHTLVILQSKEKNMRIINLGSVICWIPYYFSFKSYGHLATAIVVAISTMIGIIRFDIKRGKNHE